MVPCYSFHLSLSDIHPLQWKRMKPLLPTSGLVQCSAFFMARDSSGNPKIARTQNVPPNQSWTTFLSPPKPIYSNFVPLWSYGVKFCPSLPTDCTQNQCPPYTWPPAVNSHHCLRFPTSQKGVLVCQPSNIPAISDIADEVDRVINSAYLLETLWDSINICPTDEWY